jgi:hypothetical protein
MARLFTVSLDELSTRGRERGTRATRVHADDEDMAITKAIQKLFGSRCFWHPDSGLGKYYGQVFEALRPRRRNSTPGNSSRTDRARITVVWDHKQRRTEEPA